MSCSRLWCSFVAVAVLFSVVELASIGSSAEGGHDGSPSVGVISVPSDSVSHAAESGAQLAYGHPNNNPSQESDSPSGASDVQVVQSQNHYLPPGSQQADVGQSQGQDQFINPQDDQDNSIASIGQVIDSGAGFPTQISDINQMQHAPQGRHNVAPQNGPPVAYSQYPSQSGPTYVAAYPQPGPQIINVQPATYSQYPSSGGPSYVASYPQYSSQVRHGYVDVPHPDFGIQGHSSYPEIILDYNPELQFAPSISSYSSYPSFSSHPLLTGPSNVLSWFKNLFSLNSDC